MRILILDAAPALRDQCIAHIAAEWPGAAVDARALEPPQRTRTRDGPGEWQRYDAVLLDHHAAGHTGVEWLRACKDRAQVLPPVILLSDETGEDIAVEAMKLGAADYLRNDKLTPARLIGAINDAILERARYHDRVLARARLSDRFSDSITLPGVIGMGRSGEPPAFNPAITAPVMRAPGASGGTASVGAAHAAGTAHGMGAAHGTVSSHAAGTTHAASASGTDSSPKINGYRLIRQIGAGGTSQVFLAERLPRLGQPAPEPAQVVLKVLDANLMTDAFIERFIREYRIISAVQNKHVARIYDQGITDDHVYIAMEYFAGGDLRRRLGTRAQQANGPLLTSMQTLRIVMQAARALDAIHSAGVIHRDLKPNNIMFRHGEQLALVDFGVAKQAGENTLTATGGTLLATPLYMSPEQCLGQPQDERSDLYSLGVMLYEMFTGRRLFESDNLAAIALSHVHGEVPRLPPALAGYQTLMDRLLAKNPDGRFSSARELFAYVAY